MALSVPPYHAFPCEPHPLSAFGTGDAGTLAGAFGRVVEDYREFFELSPEEVRAPVGPATRWSSS